MRAQGSGLSTGTIRPESVSLPTIVCDILRSLRQTVKHVGHAACDRTSYRPTVPRTGCAKCVGRRRPGSASTSRQSLQSLVLGFRIGRVG